MGQEAENRNALLFYGMQTAWLQYLQGRFAEGEALMQTSRQIYPFLDANLRCALARLYMDTGREKEARAEMDYLAVDEFRCIRRNVAWLFAVAAAADAAASLKDQERARTLYRLLEPHADLNVMVAHLLPVCPVSHFLGRLAATLEQWDQAIEHFERALQRADENQAVTWTATIKYGYAEMMLERDGAGDRARALELASDALGIAQQTGMNFMLQQALSLKLKAQGIEGSDLLTSIDRVYSAVQSEHRALASHAAPDGTVTIMFSDIEGSTEIADRLGDKRFMDVIRQHNAIIREEVKAHGGFEVKSEGDGFMIAFQSARRALDCAIAIQKQLAQRNAASTEPFRMRVGLHCGEVIKEGEDFFGRNVILAARVANLAKGGEILVSGVLKALVESAGDLTWSEPRSVELKGLSGIYEIWPVAWSP